MQPRHIDELTQFRSNMVTEQIINEIQRCTAGYDVTAHCDCDFLTLFIDNLLPKKLSIMTKQCYCLSKYYKLSFKCVFCIYFG